MLVATPAVEPAPPDALAGQSQSFLSQLSNGLPEISISSTYIYNSVLCKNNGQNAFLVVTLRLEGDCARTYVERPQRVPIDVRNGVTEVLCLPNTNQKKKEAAQTEAFTSDFMHL